jgi:anion-transporting  ArsA/GET3 family ATPase
VVVDASATGHVVGQLASPVAMNDLVRVGVVRQQTEWMLEILGNPATTGVVIVATPEEMPVNESIELIDRLRSETRIDVAAVVANRVLPELFNRREEAIFDRLGEPPARDELRGELGDAIDGVLRGGRLATGLRRRGAVHLQRLRDELPGMPVVYLPERFGGEGGLAGTRLVAKGLGEELL